MKKIILIWGCLLLLVSSAYSQLSTYTFSQTAGTYIAVAGGTTLVNGLVDSGVSPVTSIGFTFNLDGTNYTQFSATSNGYMKLGGNPASSTGTTPLSTAAQMPSLAPFARDGKTNGVVVYSLTGSAPNRVLTVEWPNWFYYWGSMGTTNNLTMQVKLYETTNVIEFVYGPNNPITAYTGQCGIAVSITNYVNRTTNTNWTTSTAGTANINTIWISSSVKPSSGLTFRWSPPCNGGFQTWYADADGDGYGSSTVFQLICVQPSGYVSNALDCDDSNAAIYQGAAEVCNNGIDEDCSGSDSICVVLGCTDATASNFNPQANQDDGSCISTLTCNITAPTTTLCAGQSATLTMNTTGGAGASSQLPANLQQGLVAYYPFNGNANDESGNGNNGTVNGATLTSDRFGNVGSAYSFDGVGNFIEVASNSLLNCNSSLTINLYVRNISGNNSEMIIARERYASGTSYCLGIENSDYVLSLNNSPLNSVCPQCNKVLTSNGGLDYENWHQITGLWTGSIMSIYIDGVFVSSSNAVLPNNGQLLNSSSSLFIGKWMNLFDPTWGFRFFKGSVDDISIYNRALTPSEIQQLYTAQSYAWSTNATTPAITVSPTTNATYSCTVTQGNQTCTASVDITVNPAITNAVSATIVEGQSYTLGAQTLTTAGTYTEVFTSAAGCDSTVTLTLSVEPLLSCNLNSPSMGLCSGDQVDLSINFQITQSSSLLDSLTYAGEFGGHYYYFTQFSSNDLGQVGTQLTPLNLHDRLDIYGLDLVAIQNAEENDFVASLIPNSQFAIWIGLNDYVTNGVYLWSDGSVPSYFNWRSGEPNNNSGDEDYAIMYGPVSYPGAYSTWNDEPCGEGVGPCNPFLFLIESTYPINQNVLSYSWSTNETTPTITVSPTTNTTYSCTVTRGNSTCTASVDITVNPSITHAVSATIVEGQSYTLGTQTLTTAGTYTEVFTSAAGCDSTVTVTLAVESLLSCEINTSNSTICNGGSAILEVALLGSSNSLINNFAITNGEVSLPNPILNDDSEFTINAFLKVPNFTATTSNVFKQIVGGEVVLRVEPSQVVFQVKASYGNCYTASGWVYIYAPIQDSNYHKYSAIYNRNVGYIQLYKDDILISSQTVNNGSLANCNAYSTAVGVVNSLIFIDEISIFSYALNNSEVESIHLNELIGTEGGLRALWKFNEGTGTQILDSGPFSFNGSFNGEFVVQGQSILIDSNSYVWSNNATTPTITVSPTTNTTYSCTVTQGNQTCTASVDITVNPTVTNAVSATIVEGQSYTLGTQTLTTAGTYTEVFTSAAGCDSTVTLTLSVEPLLTCNITTPTTTLCAGQSATLTMNTTGGAGTSSQLPTNLQQGLVAYYPFNGNANDESGNGNDGIAVNMIWGQDRFGMSNQVAEFNSQYNRAITVLNPNSIQGNIFSVGAWIKSNTQLSYYNSIVDLVNTGMYFQMYGDHPSYVSAQIVGQVGFSGYLGLNNSTISLHDSNWHQVLYVVDISLGNLKIYIDGQMNATHQFAPITYNQCSRIDIGQNYNAINDAFNGGLSIFSGSIDDVVIYNRELNDSEIAQIFSNVYSWSTNATTPTITVSPTQNTTYTCTVTQGNSTCTASVDITVNPTITNAVSATIVEGQSYTLGTQTLTTAGTYTEVFTSAAGCDSTVTLTLAVEPALSCNITASSTVLCGVDNVVLDLAPVNGVFYQSGLGNYQEFNGHYYLKYSGLANWYEAKSIAEQMGGHLVIPNTIEESNFIVALSETDQSGQPFFWIGISDEIQEGVWIDVLGNQITFSNWAVGEPNNENDEDFGLAYSLSVGNGHWNDGHYFHNLPFVIEFEGIVASVSWSTNETTSSITVSPTTNTTYSCTVTSGTQTCTASIDITVNPQQTYFADADGDGYGNPDLVVQDCNAPVGYVSDNTDCNDNNALVFFASTEICNGLDDDCDGLVDEGLTVTSIQPVSASTALYPTCSGNALKSANLNNGTNSDLIEGSGLDLWYSLTAQYNTLRAGLSAAFGDNEIRLYSYSNGCFELLETEHEVYATTSLATGNQTLISDNLIPGQTYYIAVHNISGAMNTSAKMCFNHFVGSTCDHYYSNNTGVYNNVCTSFKAQYKGNATNYIFDVLSATQNNANLNITPWSYTTTTANSVVPRLGTIFPVNLSASAKVYTLRIPVIYAIPDAAGNYTSITANATTTCTVTLNPELPIALRSTDRCPNTKNTSSSISVDRAICGALRYEWEFTQQLPSVQPAVTVLGGLNTTAFFLNNVPGMGTGKTYNVRVRPIHTNGEVGSWGSVQCLKTGTSGMVLENYPGSAGAVQWANHDSPEQEERFTLYPNPTSTGRFILTANHTSDEEVKSIKMMDITGKVVYKTQVVLNDNSLEVDFGNLASGMYVVMVGEERMRLVIQ